MPRKPTQSDPKWSAIFYLRSGRLAISLSQSAPFARIQMSDISAHSLMSEHFESQITQGNNHAFISTMSWLFCVGDDVRQKYTGPRSDRSMAPKFAKLASGWLTHKRSSSRQHGGFAPLAIGYLAKLSALSYKNAPSSPRRWLEREDHFRSGSVRLAKWNVSCASALSNLGVEAAQYA